MKVHQRRRQILSIIRENEDIVVEDLSHRFGVSESTIRRDLKCLADENLIRRNRGGASTLYQFDFELPILTRTQIMRIEKEAVGRLAATLIEEGDTIFLSGGTTTKEVARNLTNIRRITVVTSAINIINYLVNFPDITVIVPGGTLVPKHLTLVGDISKYTLDRLRIDKVFLGVSAIDIDQGITSESLEDAVTDRNIANIARKLIVVTDSSKFGIVRTALITPVEEVDYIITDSKIAVSDVDRIRQLGVEIILAGLEN